MWVWICWLEDKKAQYFIDINEQNGYTVYRRKYQSPEGRVRWGYYIKVYEP